MSRCTRRPIESRPLRAALICAAWLTVFVLVPATADDDLWRRAYVPADAPEVWPSGEWAPVPLNELELFLEDRSKTAAERAPQPVIDRAVYRGSLTEDGFCEGTLEFDMSRPTGVREVFEFGDVSLALSGLTWDGESAIWGTAPDDRMLLLVEQPAGKLKGEWSIRGRPVFGRRDFNFRLPAAGSTRIELTLPNAMQLRCSDGIVLPPVDAEPGHRTWLLEIGGRSQCTCTVESIASTGAPLVQCERSLVYSIRADICRIQADFTVHARHAVPGELIFDVPADLHRVSTTYAASTSLTSRLEVQEDSARLHVPLPNLTPGRIGTIRIVGDVPLRQGSDWQLPEVSLQGAVLTSGERRMHIDRPLTLNSVTLSDVRQTGVDADASGGDWFYEDLSAESAVTVHIGRPTLLTTARVLTWIDATDDAAVFRAAIELQCHSGSAFHAVFRMPTDWRITDVVPVAQSTSSGVASWRVAAGEGENWLDVEFRQALTPQSTRRILVTGRWTGAASNRVLEPFPAPASADESSVVLGIVIPERWTLSAGEGGGLQQLDGPPGAAWGELLQVLQSNDNAAQAVWLAANGDSQSERISLLRTTDLPSDRSVDASPRPKPPAPDADHDRDHTLNLTLHSAVAGLKSKWIWHVARYRLSPHDGNLELAFRLPSPASFDSLTVDGVPHEVLVSSDRVQPAPFESSAAEIAVHFRTPMTADRSILERTAAVPLPEWNTPVAGFEWRVAAPDTVRLIDCGVPFSVATEQWEPSWSERVFGPLARAPDTDRFNPREAAEWQTLFDFDENAGVSADGRRVREIGIAAVEAPSTAIVTLVDAGLSRGLGWAVLFAALIAAVIVRRVTGVMTPLAATAGFLLIGALIADAPYVAMLGGGFAGIGLGCLLPRSWIERRDILSGWGNESRAKRRRAAMAACIAGMIGLAGVTNGTTRAQQGETRAAAAVGDSTEEPPAVDILIPYAGNEPGQLAYVRRQLLPQFEAWRTAVSGRPDYLLSAARYQNTASDPDTLRAEFDVTMLSSERPIVVRLPLRNISFRDSNDCEVDGRRTPLRPNAAGTGWLVEIRAALDVDDDTNQGNAARTVSIVVPMRLASGPSALDMGVPPVLDSSFRLHGLIPAQVETSALGGVRQSADGSLLGALGGISTLSVSPVDAPSPDGAPTSMSGDALSLIEAHPLRARIRTRLTPDFSDDASGAFRTRTMSLLLPGRTEVREVAAEGLRGFSAAYDSESSTLLELEFDAPVADGSDIHLDYSVPLSQVEGVTALPPLSLLNGGRLQSHRIGLRPARGLSLSTLPPATDVVQELPVQLFDAPDETSWPAPEAAFVLREPAALPVRLNRIDPQRSVALEQTLAIGEQRIDWTLSAVIDVSAAPAYSHRLQVGSNARIDQVSVLQDGADRLLSWSLDGDRLTVNVQGESIGRQELLVTGRLPLDTDSPVAVPSSTFADATLSASELVIQNATHFVIDLLDESGMELPVEPVAAAGSGPSDAVSLRRLPMLTAGRPRALRLQAPAVPPPVNLVVTLRPEKGLWRMTTLFRATPGEQLPAPFEIRAPRSLATAIATDPGVVISWPSQPGGEGAGEFVSMELSPAEGSEWVECSVTLLLPQPTTQKWPLPIVAPAAAPVAERWLQIADDAPFVPDPDAADRLEPDETVSITSDDAAGGEKFASFRMTSAQIALRQRPTDQQPFDVPLAETVVWSDDEHRQAGVTIWHIVPHQQHCTVEALLPDGVHMNRILWNSHAVDASATSAATAAIDLFDLTPESANQLELHWRRQDAAAGRRLIVERPRPSDIEPDSELLTVLPPRGFDCIPHRDGGPPSAARSGLLRLEKLVQLATDRRVASGSEAGLSLLHHQIEATLASTTSQSLDDEEQRRLATVRRRWSELQTPTVSQFKEPLVDTHIIDSVRVSPHAVPIPVSSNTDVIELWIVRQRSWLLVTALLAIAAATALFWRRRSWLPARWTPAPYAGLVIAGLVWWLWFMASALGLALLATGLALQVSGWLRTPRSESIAGGHEGV